MDRITGAEQEGLEIAADSFPEHEIIDMTVRLTHEEPGIKTTINGKVRQAYLRNRPRKGV